LFLTHNSKSTFADNHLPAREVVILTPPPPAVQDVPPPLPPPPKPPASIEHVTGVISATGTDTIPTIDALIQPVQIGTTTRAGDSSGVTGPIPSFGETSGNTTEVPPQEIAPAVYHSVEEMPEFPGGSAALQRFLLKHLRVPDEALEPGNRITVRVQFIVDKNGGITGLEVLKSGGEVFNKEVLRVLNKMPAWKRGRQNGMQVPVYYQLPVTFETHE
jgi:protein TonB